MLTLNTVLPLLAQSPPPPGAGGHGEWLIWGIVLLAIAIALFFVEVFLPTGGVFGIASGVCAVAGIVMFFRIDTTLGLLTAGGCLIATPFLLVFALRLWPDTPFGKWVTLTDQQQRLNRPGQAPQTGPQGGSRRGLSFAVGAKGKTLTTLRPVGTCLIDGRREECLSRSGSLDPGQDIVVVAVDGSEVWVAPSPPNPPTASD